MCVCGSAGARATRGRGDGNTGFGATWGDPELSMSKLKSPWDFTCYNVSYLLAAAMDGLHQSALRRNAMHTFFLLGKVGQILIC